MKKNAFEIEKYNVNEFRKLRKSCNARSWNTYSNNVILSLTKDSQDDEILITDGFNCMVSKINFLDTNERKIGIYYLSFDVFFYGATDKKMSQIYLNVDELKSNPNDNSEVIFNKIKSLIKETKENFIYKKHINKYLESYVYHKKLQEGIEINICTEVSPSLTLYNYELHKNK